MVSIRPTMIGGDEGAADRADAADDDDDEGQDQDVLAHADLDGEDRRLHQPAKPASAAPSPNTKV